MKKRSLFLPILFLVSYHLFSQGVGIGTTTPDASATLDITHTAKGLLMPRMNTGSMNTIANPAKGLLVYDSLANQLMVNTGTPAAPSWQPVASNSSGWRLAGISGTNPVSQFIGTTDNQPLRFRIGNTRAGELNPVTKNIFWGLRAGGTVTMKLRPVTYQLDIPNINRKLNMRSGGKIDDQSKQGVTENEKTIFSGFVAQEVEQAAREVDYDFSGIDKPKNENDFYGLRYADFVVPVVKAIQEQQQMINELKEQNAELKKNNSVQKNLNESLLKRLEKLESSLATKK